MNIMRVPPPFGTNMQSQNKFLTHKFAKRVCKNHHIMGNENFEGENFCEFQGFCGYLRNFPL